MRSCQRSGRGSPLSQLGLNPASGWLLALASRTPEVPPCISDDGTRHPIPSFEPWLVEGSRVAQIKVRVDRGPPFSPAETPSHSTTVGLLVYSAEGELKTTTRAGPHDILNLLNSTDEGTLRYSPRPLRLEGF